MTVQTQAPGYHTITPFLTIDGAEAFIAFARVAFGADQTELMRMPDGKVAHAEIRIGDSLVMVADGAPMSSALYVYVPDVDATYRKALDAGATSHTLPGDQFWGDREASVRDAWGTMWFIATHKEDVALDELQRRQAAAAATR